jgi:hypothetical protein
MKTKETYRPDPDLDRLLSDHVDGLLDQAGEEMLADRLRNDVAAREYYLRYLSLHGALHWDYAEAACVPTSTPPPGKEKQMGSSLFAIGIGIAAALCAGLFLWMATGPENLVTVEFAESAVFRGGGATKVLGEGMLLPAGSVNVESATGFAQLRFEDGTLVTLDGGSELDYVMEKSQKSLRLWEGNLTADVAPQPEGAPMRIVTPTAEIEVLGTVLSVRSEDFETGLSVDEGRVRFRRLSDGEQIDVPARHQTSASLDFEGRLVLEKSSVPDTTWQLVFDDPGIRVTKGIRDMEGECFFYRSEPYVARRDAGGSPLVRDGVAINGRLVRLTDESYLVLRYRSEATPGIFLSLADSEGGFGGNLEARVPDESLSADAEGWREAKISLRDFRTPARRGDRETDYPSSIVKKVLISVQGNEEIDVAAVLIDQ